MQAQLYRASFSPDDFKMEHLCQFMKSFEQDEEQDFRIMSATLFKQGERVLAAFGTSHGQVQVYWVNFSKRRMEDVSKLEFNSSILSMKRVTN